MAPDADLHAILLQQAGEALGDHPGLQHRLEKDHEVGTSTLTLSTRSDDGFEVVVEATPADVTVVAGGAHVHFDEFYDPDLDPETLVAEALGLVGDLLSPAMRVRELRASGKPYRWFIETFDGSGWHVEHVTGLLFWNYFGHRTERVYQKPTLTDRLANEHPSV